MDNRQSGVAGKDARVLLAQRKAHSGDFWATKDGRWGVGSPFSTIDCGLVLVELGIRPADPLAHGIAELLFACRTDDGRIRPGRHLSVQPCHTANAARLLCRLGYSRAPRLAAVNASRSQSADSQGTAGSPGYRH